MVKEWKDSPHVCSNCLHVGDEPPLYLSQFSLCLFLCRSLTLLIWFLSCLSAAIFLVHNGRFVRVICFSCWLLMGALHVRRAVHCCLLGRTLAYSLPVRIHFPWRFRQACTSAQPARWAHNLSVVISCMSPSQAALAPFSHIKSLLSPPMFTELLSLPNQEWDGVKLGSNPSLLPKPRRFTLGGGFQRGKLNMFKAINVISTM